MCSHQGAVVITEKRMRSLWQGLLATNVIRPGRKIKTAALFFCKISCKAAHSAIIRANKPSPLSHPRKSAPSASSAFPSLPRPLPSAKIRPIRVLRVPISPTPSPIRENPPHQRPPRSHLSRALSNPQKSAPSAPSALPSHPPRPHPHLPQNQHSQPHPAHFPKMVYLCGDFREKYPAGFQAPGC